MNFEAFSTAFLELTKQNVPLVIVTMTNYRGSAPQDVGARMIVGVDGLLLGTVGGGKIEKKCLDVAQEMLRAADEAKSTSHTWNLQRDIGMSCGGEVTMFFEPHRPQDKWTIAIFGAGHISQELTRILLRLNCRLIVTDTRVEWLAKLPDAPKLEKRCEVSMKDVIKTLPDNAFVALMTMGHANDAPVLFEALKTRNFPYLGVIGSTVKRIKLEAEMKELGLDAHRATEFLCPLGEDFGTNDPAEIALSIAAQMLKARL